MALTTTQIGNELVTYRPKLIQEFLRKDQFNKLKSGMGDKIIHVEKSTGGEINIPYMSNLNGRGVFNNEKLSNNEEALKDSNFRMRAFVNRNGTSVSRKTIKDASFTYRNPQVVSLKNWMKQREMDMATRSMLGIEIGGVKLNYGGDFDPSVGIGNYQKATNAQLDSWNTNNADRLLYGSATSNYVAGDHTASLANIDTTNDKLTRAVIRLAKQSCYDAYPPINPLMAGADFNESYLLLVGTIGFNQIQDDMAGDLKEARERSKEHPIFTGADFEYDGIYVKHYPLIDYMIDGSNEISQMYGSWGSQSNEDLRTAGNSSTRVAPAFLLGAQAIAQSLEDPVELQQDEGNTDYGEFVSLSIRQSFDYRPIYFKDDKQHGIFTIFHSAARS